MIFIQQIYNIIFQKLFVLLSVFILVGCQQKPTKIIEQTADAFDKNIVLMDTRSALDYESFHIQGSQNLLTEDFILLVNPLAKKESKKRVLDPDLKQIVERLAKKGISPLKRVYLIGSTKNSINNLKWKWLLSLMDVKDIHLYSSQEVRKMKNGRFEDATAQKPWPIQLSQELQNEFIYKNSYECFVRKTQNWNKKICG